MVQAIHTAVAGRARFRVEGLYRSEPLKRLLEFRLSRIGEITHVSVSALTGHVLVCFNSGSTPQTIESLLAEIVQEHQQKLNNGGLPEVAAADASTSVIPAAASSWEKVRGLFSGPADQAQELWHLLPADTALAKYQTSKETGLTAQAVQDNLRRFGANVLPESQPRSAWEMFASQFNSLPVALLGAAAGLSVLTGGLLDAALIMGVVVINAFIGYLNQSHQQASR